MTRSADKARRLFGDHPNLTAAVADARDASTLPAAMAGVDAVACCTGTTAFPSSRWEGDNGPRPTDLVGTTNLIAAAPKSLARFVLVTSAGVERQKQLPWAILNTFGALVVCLFFLDVCVRKRTNTQTANKIHLQLKHQTTKKACSSTSATPSSRSSPAACPTRCCAPGA
jgi:hypothetical protein